MGSIGPFKHSGSREIADAMFLSQLNGISAREKEREKRKEKGVCGRMTTRDLQKKYKQPIGVVQEVICSENDSKLRSRRGRYTGMWFFLLLLLSAAAAFRPRGSHVFTSARCAAA